MNYVMLILQSIFNVIIKDKNEHAVLYGPSFSSFQNVEMTSTVRTKIIKGRRESGESVKIKLFCSNAVAFKEIRFKWLHVFVVCWFSLAGVGKNVDKNGSEK